MAFELKTEPGSPPGFSSGAHKSFKVMSISELVSVLRTAYQVDDFDKVEDELVSRDAKLKAEIGPLSEKIVLEREIRVRAEEELLKKEEQCERGKRAQEDYERLLKKVKKNGLVEASTINELTKKSIALKLENDELKKKWDDDDNVRAELRSMRLRNSELEKIVKENLSIIEEMKAKNQELADDKSRQETMNESLEKKFRELNEIVVKLEEEASFLLRPAEAVVIKYEEEDCNYKLGEEIEDTAHLQRDKDTCKGNKDALRDSAMERWKSNVIEILDSDDEQDNSGSISQALLGKKVAQVIAKIEHQSSTDVVQPKNIFTEAHGIETGKRKFSCSDVETSSNSSSSSDFNFDNLPSCKKKSKT